MSQPLVSGPGALSQRTDGGQPIRHIADAKYGEDKAFVEQQKMAPLAEAGTGGQPTPAVQSPPPSPGPGPTPSGPSQAITPFDAPTAMPDQPVTSGMQLGGAPPPVPQIQPSSLSDALAPYFAADDTGILADFAWQLSERGL